MIDGNNSLGAVVGNFAMGVAIAKAKETGVGWVMFNIHVNPLSSLLQQEMSS